MSNPFLRKESGCFPLLHNYVIIIPHLWYGVKFFLKKCVARFWKSNIAKSRYRNSSYRKDQESEFLPIHIPLIIL